MKAFRWFFGLWVHPRRRPRPRSAPPINYNPDGLWRDYFNTLDQRMNKSTVTEDRDLYDRDTNRR